MAMHVAPQRSALLSPSSGKRLHLLASHRKPTEPELPEEVLLLKNRICKAHPAKCFAFSLAHMRKVAVPPVQLPRLFRRNIKSLLVGGHLVPFTREMWKKSRFQLMRRRLDRIHENVVYD